MSDETTIIKFMHWKKIDTIDVHMEDGRRVLFINENLSEQLLLELIKLKK